MLYSDTFAYITHCIVNTFAHIVLHILNCELHLHNTIYETGRAKCPRYTRVLRRGQTNATRQLMMSTAHIKHEGSPALLKDGRSVSDCEPKKQKALRN